MSKNWLLTLCFISFSSILFPQEPTYVHYGMLEGLPSTQVYQSIQDSRGFMWFATDRGLVRYNGYDFRTLTRSDGLPDDVVFGFHKDRNDRVWFYTYHGGIAYLENDSIVIPSFNDSLIDKLGTTIIGSMYVDELDTIWLGLRLHSRLVKIDPKGKVHSFKPPDRSLLRITEIDSGGFIFGFGGEFVTRTKVFLHTANKGYNFQLPEGENYNYPAGCAIKTNQSFYCAQNKALLKVSSSGIQQETILTDKATMSLFKDNEKDIWVGVSNKGAFRFKQGDLNSSPDNYLKGYSVSSIYEDSEGGYWFTTLYAGIFYAPTISLTNKVLNNEKHGEPISTISAWSHNAVWIGTQRGQVYIYNRHQDSCSLLLNGLSEITFLYKIGQKRIVGYNGDLRRRGLFNDSIYITSNLIASLDYTQRNMVLHNVFNDQNIPPEVTVLESYNLDMINIQAIYQWNDLVYAGGKGGLYKLENKEWITCPGTEHLWVVDITSSKEHLFIATKHNGVVVYDGQKFFRITQEDGLPINYVETIAIENDSVIWVGSKKGVSKVHVNFKNEEVHVFNINSSNGLISDEVSDICINNKQAWVGTNAGMSFFDTDKSFENELPPPVFLEVISVNGIPQSNFKSQIFPHTSQVFDFSFFGINYKSRVPLTYRYRLIGLDSTWHETKGREVSYSLPNGKYRFEALAQNNSGIWSKKPAVFEFEIQTPYWKQLWFLLALTFLFLGIVALVIQYRINRIKEKNRIKLQMAESQQIALNAQLKPHFIFNALNSIHNYIRKNDREASGKYLLLFSKLIRQILMNSNKPVVTIEEEVSLLQKYLEIEKLRFKDRMNYNIIIDPKIDVSRLKIPTQLVQPYLENAIWHGIMNKETSGSITFELKLESAKMRCIIVDNGIGREAAMGFKSDNYHQSSGMVISEKRLKLIEATLKKKVEITITDLKDAAGKATGTKVELVFPIIE